MSDNHYFIKMGAPLPSFEKQTNKTDKKKDGK